ncbi:MAG TPA: hypothetical protein VF646_02035 [Cytophagales bacterium]
MSQNVALRKQGFILEATAPTSDAIADIPNGRTVLVADLTDAPAGQPEISYELETIEAVFAHYKPTCKVTFGNRQGEPVNETLRFNHLGDFGPKGIVAQSRFMQELEASGKDYQAFARQLRGNKTLQNLLAEPAKKAAYLTVLQILLNELEENQE